ncbi:MAG: hypothetical protein K1060chlam1_00060 [Candidatus Anoxychlamydiales bacterium]|nr:hypothetical protein [Candidatus Anoxychlamydiales bacterium]
MHQLLLFCILTTQFIYISIIRVDPSVRDKIIIPLAVSFFAFFSAPIQGGLSDYYCRKKSIVFAMLINLVASVFFVFWLLWHNVVYLIIYILMLGIAGNVTPIAVSAFKDITRKFMNFRFFVCMSLFYYFVGDYSQVVSKNFLEPNTLLIIAFALVILCTILVFFIFKDIKDRELPKRLSIREEFVYIYHNFLKHKYFIMGVIGYFFLEISLYQFAFRSEVFDGFLSKVAPIEMISGAFLGMIFLKFSKISDEKVFIYAIGATFFCFLFLLLSQIFHLTNPIYSIALMLFFGFNYSLVYSCVYCLFTRKRHHHDHGKIFGIIESMDSLSYLVAIVIVYFLQKVSPQTIWLISLVFIIISIIFFLRFLKHDKKVPHIT